MKPAICGLDYSTIMNTEWSARFAHKPGGSPAILATIADHYRPDDVRASLKAARERKQVALVWLHPTPAVLSQSIFHPAYMLTHPDLLDFYDKLEEHCGLGGKAVVGINGEFDQWWKWGGEAYRNTFNAIRARFPEKGAWASWDKAPFRNGPAKGGALKFEEWEPDVYEFAGLHPYSNVLTPGTPAFDDNRRFIDFIGDRKSWAFLEGGFTAGDIRDPAQSATYFKRLRGLWAELDVRVSAAPLNSTWGGQSKTLGWTTGRYAPGAHDPPLKLDSPAWAGSPKFCTMLEDALAWPGKWVEAGDAALEVLG